MAHIRYRIPLISVAALTAYAKEVSDGVYSYNLNKAETQSVIMRGGNTLQDDNAIFYQAMQVITLDQFEQPQKDCVIEDLYEVLPFFDFSGIFDYKNASIKKIVRSKKAESIFRPDGVVLDFGNGPQRFHAFERSASMSRQAKLSFINEKYVMQLKKRVTLDLKLKKCQLSKLYAYNGLLYSSGIRADLTELWENNSICVIDNPEYESPELDIITVKDVSGVGSTRTYKRAEEKTRLKIKGFDGEGLISPDFAEKLDIACYGQHTHHSFQIRMPYIKGMVHEVDFKGIFHEAHIKNIYDIWGITTSGLLSEQQALEILTIGPLYEQIVIKTEKALSHLRFVRATALEHADIAAHRAVVAEEESAYWELVSEKLGAIADILE